MLEYDFIRSVQFPAFRVIQALRHFIGFWLRIFAGAISKGTFRWHASGGCRASCSLRSQGEGHNQWKHDYYWGNRSSWQDINQKFWPDMAMKMPLVVLWDQRCEHRQDRMAKKTALGVRDPPPPLHGLSFMHRLANTAQLVNSVKWVTGLVFSTDADFCLQLSGLSVLIQSCS